MESLNLLIVVNLDRFKDLIKNLKPLYFHAAILTAYKSKIDLNVLVDHAPNI